MKEKYSGNKIRIIFINPYYKMNNLGHLKKKPHMIQARGKGEGK